eukprot:6486891-Amphidinium_carterae.3
MIEAYGWRLCAGIRDGRTPWEAQPPERKRATCSPAKGKSVRWAIVTAPLMPSLERSFLVAVPSSCIVPLWKAHQRRRTMICADSADEKDVCLFLWSRPNAKELVETVLRYQAQGRT